MAPRTDARFQQREAAREQMLIFLRDSGLRGVVPKNPNHTISHSLQGDTLILKAGVKQPLAPGKWQSEIAISCRLTVEELDELLATLMEARHEMKTARALDNPDSTDV